MRPKPLIATFNLATVSPLTGVDDPLVLGVSWEATRSKKEDSLASLAYVTHEVDLSPENSVTSSLFEAHWVGKECEALDGNLVLVGILVEARAAWVAMAATRLALQQLALSEVYINK